MKKSRDLSKFLIA